MVICGQVWAKIRCCKSKDCAGALLDCWLGSGFAFSPDGWICFACASISLRWPWIYGFQAKEDISRLQAGCKLGANSFCKEGWIQKDPKGILSFFSEFVSKGNVLGMALHVYYCPWSAVWTIVEKLEELKHIWECAEPSQIYTISCRKPCFPLVPLWDTLYMPCLSMSLCFCH